jgi:hypothetical protein
VVIVATKRQSAIVSHWSCGEKFSPDRFSLSASSDSGKDTQSCLLEVVRQSWREICLKQILRCVS